MAQVRSRPLDAIGRLNIFAAPENAPISSSQPFLITWVMPPK